MRIMVVSPVRMFRDSLAGVLGSMDPVPEVVGEVSLVALPIIARLASSQM